MTEPAMREGVALDLLGTQAVRAWKQLRPGAGEPERIELLRWRPATGRKTVFRLAGVGPRGTAVIAKRCRQAKAAVEWAIHEEVLPRLPIPTLRCYGAVGEEGGQFAWLFIEDAGDGRYSALNDEHRRLAARWLGILHSTTAGSATPDRLPDRGPSSLLEILRSAHERILAHRANPALEAADLGTLKAILSRCEALEARWDRVADLYAAMPQAIVHGDFKENNVRVRTGASGTVLLPFDWAFAGVGAPALDLARLAQPCPGYSCHPDLEAYWDVVRVRWTGLKLPTIRRWADLGSLHRTLAAINWTAPSLAYEWVRRPMTEMEFYLTILTSNKISRIF